MTDQATENELRELFSMEPDDGPLEDRIATCSGYWERSGDVWRFHDESDDRL